MPDRETIIGWLEGLAEADWRECYSDSEVQETALQALDLIDELLKEQEAVKPIYIENPYTHLPVSYCPKCREPIDQYITGNPYRKTKYCHYCGKAVKWNE